MAHGYSDKAATVCGRFVENSVNIQYVTKSQHQIVTQLSFTENKVTDWILSSGWEYKIWIPPAFFKIFFFKCINNEDDLLGPSYGGILYSHTSPTV